MAQDGELEKQLSTTLQSIRAQNLPTGRLLSGAESQRLRSFCSQETYTADELDDYAQITLATGTLEDVQTDFEARVQQHGLEYARQELASIAYGPTNVPLFNFLLQLTVLNPAQRPKYVEVIRCLALEAKVPVDTPDLSGNTTLMYSISTKPYFDTEIADILLEAGGNINTRNRYGCVAAHDIVMVGDYSTAGKRKSVDALRYFIQKGGNIDVADGDGITARKIAMNINRVMPEFSVLLGGPAPRISGPSPVKKAFKVGRNEPCSCGSGRKYKVCCGKN